MANFNSTCLTCLFIYNQIQKQHHKSLGTKSAAPLFHKLHINSEPPQNPFSAKSLKHRLVSKYESLDYDVCENLLYQAEQKNLKPRVIYEFLVLFNFQNLKYRVLGLPSLAAGSFTFSQRLELRCARLPSMLALNFVPTESITF